MRVGSSIKPISPDRVISSLPVKDVSAAGLSAKVGQLAETISKQSTAFEDLHKELAKANSWRGKLPDWIIGGVIGAIIGAIISMIVGAD